MKKPNFLFYAICFAFNLFLCSTLISGTVEPGRMIKAYFLGYAFLQSLLEISIIALIGYWIEKYLPRWSFNVFLGGFCFYLFARFIDFIMIRLMDRSIFYAFKIFFLSGWNHFFASIRAMNLNLTMSLLITVTTCLLPFVGTFLYSLCRKVSKRTISPSLLVANLFSLSILLFLFDSTSLTLLDLKTYLSFKKSLPLKFTFLHPKGPALKLNMPMKPGETENKILTALKDQPLNTDKKPLIFLFVVETLRDDFITEETAPHLVQFRNKNISIPFSFSNAQGSHLSWYSIFFSFYPHHWPHHKNTWENGSPSLQLLKDLGYQIHLLTSADLSYYQMDDMLFGKDRQVLTSFYDYNVKWPNRPELRDQKAISDLVHRINALNDKEGHFFLVFLDSTHSEYSWTEDFETEFLPISDKIHYLKMIRTKEDIPLLKNRYRNSIHFIDSLFGKVIQSLKEKDLYDDSMIVFTGDHGEEFFEEGALFHGTHLNDLQTRVPIYYHIPSKHPIERTLTSHVDIFPTLFHVLLEKNFSIFDGHSLFDPLSLPYTYCFMQNGGGTPNEFFLHNGSCKLFARFSDARKIYQSKSVEVLFIEKNQQKFQPNQKEVEEFLSEHFNGALKEICQIDAQ